MKHNVFFFSVMEQGAQEKQ